MTPPRSAFSRSVGVEIGVHIAVVVAIYIPILVILFPAALLLTGSVIASSFAPEATISLWLSSESRGPLAASIGITILVAVASAVTYLLRHKGDPNSLKCIRGAEGKKLKDLVSDMWAKISDGQAPNIRWFPAFDIAGFASTREGQPELQVSAGLWQAAVEGKDTAKAIIAHELAHLRNNDPRVLEILDVIRVVAASVLIFTALTSLAIFCVVLATETSSAFTERGVGGMVFRSLLVIAGAGMVLVIFPLSWLALRRHIGYIHSLLEIRADIDAALWTEGRENFTQAFATSKSVRRSGHRELFTALLSRKLSHIPERERLHILRSPALLITPKVQFFALSILLAVALPLNFSSGLFLNGSLNHWVAQGAAIAFNVVLVGSLSVGQTDGRVKIGAPRIATLALVSVLVSALPRVNLEPVSFLIMSWTLGFDGAPADLSTLSENLWITLQDLSGKLTNAFLNAETTIAFFVAMSALKGFVAISAQPSVLSAKLRVGSAMFFAMLGSLVAGYDPFRSITPSIIPDIAEWLEEHEIGYSILLLAPIAWAFLADALFVGVRRMVEK